MWSYENACEKSFKKQKNSSTRFCCFHINVTIPKILGQSNKFSWSYSFLKGPLWGENIPVLVSQEKGNIKKFLTSKQTNSAHKYFSGIWANQHLDKIIIIRLIFVHVLFSNNFSFGLSCHVYIAINSEIDFFFKAVEM